MAAAGELFTIDELQQLSIMQLRRVCSYLGVSYTDKEKPAKLIDKIIEFQKPQIPVEYSGNPDWNPNTPRSARVQRIYEARIAGKRI